MDMKLEVVVLPVSDVGRALDIYKNGCGLQEITTCLAGR